MNPLHDEHWWPWGQHSRNHLLAFMLWLTSKYRWHQHTYMRGVALLDRVARTSLRPPHLPSLEYHSFLLALAAMSLACKFEEGRPTESCWVQQPDGRLAELPSGKWWGSLVADFNACLQMHPPLTCREARAAEMRLANALQWKLHGNTTLETALARIDTADHGKLFALQLLLRTCTFLIAPHVDAVGLAEQLLTGKTDHPDVELLRAWLASPLPHPVLALERRAMRQSFPCLFV